MCIEPIPLKNFFTDEKRQRHIVFLPYVPAVDLDNYQIGRWIREAENMLLDRVKAELDEAGVAWIDIRTNERSKPDYSAEGDTSA